MDDSVTHSLNNCCLGEWVQHASVLDQLGRWCHQCGIRATLHPHHPNVDRPQPHLSHLLPSMTEHIVLQMSSYSAQPHTLHLLTIMLQRLMERWWSLISLWKLRLIPSSVKNRIQTQLCVLANVAHVFMFTPYYWFCVAIEQPVPALIYSA